MKRGSERWTERTIFGLATLAMCLALLGLAGCGHRSDQQIQQQAARTTERVKAGAKEAAAEAKVAAANAERKTNDVAAGVRQGLHGNSSSGSANSSPVDINSAGQSRLTTLPGISAARAGRIIRNRPYAAPRDLVSKGILTRAEYDRIAGRVVAGGR